MDKLQKYFISGALVGVLIWIIFTICDAFDEFILKVESCTGFIACFAVPLILSIIYIIIYLKNKPALIKIFLWFAGFLSFSIILAFIICCMVNNHTYIISNSCKGCVFLCLNGIEYCLYAFFTIGGFFLIATIFHIIYAIIKHFSNKRRIS